ncbi:hypothetical protein NQ318_021470 [Aromia moschata]|uniref:DUF4817 domain-containing protein n=2 Tax=Aromia moschata TaxID=1265417 RepID=A0AAV8ZD27_9CUCU|nr:hypothetical protein NQ318_021470 [Aromia moschata]
MIGYGDRARTQCEVVRLFRETHPDLPPLNQGTISKIEAQYREMGHVRKVPSKRQAVVDDDTKLNLLLALEENPITPARQLARDNTTLLRFFTCWYISTWTNTPPTHAGVELVTPLTAADAKNYVSKRYVLPKKTGTKETELVRYHGIKSVRLQKAL